MTSPNQIYIILLTSVNEGKGGKNYLNYWRRCKNVITQTGSYGYAQIGQFK